jgi:hypothetical protein
VPVRVPSPRATALLRLLPLVLIVLFATFAGGSPREQQVRAIAATGNVKLVNSRDGAIVSAEDMVPGDTVTGALTLANSGDTTAALTLSSADLQDTLSPGGGRLSDALFVQIDDLTAQRTVYDGALGAMEPVRLAAIPGGGARDFRFTVTMPSVRGNAYQLASTSVRYDWTATADPGGGEDPPPPPPAGDTRAPRLALGGKRRQRLRHRTVVVSAVCDEDCTLGARAHVKRVRGGVPRPVASVRPAAFMPAGDRATLRVVFTRRSVRLIRWRAKRGALVHVRVTARDEAGNVGSRVRRVRLQLKR